jgi:uncharacterized membrane protein YjjB (DUF3815 family)
MDITQTLIQWAIGFTVTLGFAVLFSVPRRVLLSVATVGAFGHLLRIVLKTEGVAIEVATLFGALFVGLAGYWQARRVHTPRLLFTITGIIVMVPGVPAYEMIMYFRNNEVLEGIQSGFRVAMITGAIAAGLSIARALTELEWRRTEQEED